MQPRPALEAAIAAMLDDGPCYVAFSGGCDSSLVLSAATATCRAMGHGDPIPVSYRYGADEADEREYQELLVRHLGLREWVTLDFGVEADLLSPATCEELLASGPMWPPAPLTRASKLRTLAPGVLLTGEGGDDVLGPRRTTYLERAVRAWRPRRTRQSLQLLRRGVVELLPRQLRTSAARRTYERNYGAAWLEDDLRRCYLDQAASLAASEPLRPSEWFGHYLARPQVSIGHSTLRAFKARLGLRWEAPLTDSTFLGSLRGAMRWHDYRGRAHLLRTYFGELLPDAIVARRTKASFNRALFGPYTRAFAQQWDGTGAPPGVNASWLKQHWSSDAVSAGTAPLLHHVWLASHARGCGHA